MTAVDGNSSYYLDVAVTSIPVAGASTVACTTALFVLMYFKMYRHFTYRLVLYTLVMATLSSLLGHYKLHSWFPSTARTLFCPPPVLKFINVPKLFINIKHGT